MKYYKTYRIKGSCVLKCGDCIELMKTIYDNSIDFIITSPPYDNLRNYTDLVTWNFDIFKKAANEIKRILKSGGCIVWVVSDATIRGSETGTSFKQALYFKEIGLRLYDTMLFVKKNPIPLTHNRYEQSFEYMFCFSKGIPKTFNPIKIECKNAGKLEKYGEGRRAKLDSKQSMRVKYNTYYAETKAMKLHNNIFEYSIGHNRTGHPAPFPYELAKDQIETWTNKNDIVLDPFSGSFTSGIACINTDRRFIGIEIEPEYFEIGKKRIQEAYDQKLKQI